MKSWSKSATWTVKRKGCTSGPSKLPQAKSFMASKSWFNKGNIKRGDVVSSSCNQPNSTGNVSKEGTFQSFQLKLRVPYDPGSNRQEKKTRWNWRWCKSEMWFGITKSRSKGIRRPWGWILAKLDSKLWLLNYPLHVFGWKRLHPSGKSFRHFLRMMFTSRKRLWFMLRTGFGTSNEPV